LKVQATIQGSLHDDDDDDDNDDDDGGGGDMPVTGNPDPLTSITHSSSKMNQQ